MSLLSSPDPARAAFQRAQLGFWAAWVLALWLKLMVATLDGTIDVKLYSKYGTTLAHSDLRTAYASDPLYNATPLTAYYCAWLTERCGPATPAFGFFLRLPGILAEAVLAIFLWKRCARVLGLRRWIAAIFVLNPMALTITGFHGNVDGLLAVCLGAALLAAADERPVACGLWFALAANLKVAPVLIAPAFFFWWLARGPRSEGVPPSWIHDGGTPSLRGPVRPFCMAATAGILAGWSPGLLMCPQLFLARVIGYGGIWGTWGVSRLLYLTGSLAFHAIEYRTPSLAAALVATFLKLLVIAVALTLAWRRRKLSASGLVATVAAIWAVFLTIAPGGATQYTIWLALPLLLYSVRLAVIYFIASVPLLIVFYPPAVAWMLTYNFYPSIIAIYPDYIDPLTWTWPALVFWVVLCLLLIREAPRWWSPAETVRVPGEAPVLP